MASFRGASFDPTSLPWSRATRPSLQQRAQSSSSEASSVSEDQFAFSRGNTPSREYAPSTQARLLPSMTASVDPISLARQDANTGDELLYGKQVSTTVTELHDTATPTRSRPIAIELPSTHKRKPFLDPDSASADTPPAPLSARGDIPGGYFPLHEDPKSRVWQPHPFQLDASKAKHRSMRRAATASQASTHAAASIPEPTYFPLTGPPAAATMSESHTPESSYIPVGAHDGVALPLGKYHPSNYGKLTPSRSRNHKTTAAPHDPHQEPSPARDNPDVQRRLLRYQQDMTYMAMMGVVRSKEGAASGASGVPDSTLSIIQTCKPVSPRLTPLGSPGPITPMSLEAGEDGYVTVSRLTDRS